MREPEKVTDAMVAEEVRMNNHLLGKYHYWQIPIVCRQKLEKQALVRYIQTIGQNEYTGNHGVDVRQELDEIKLVLLKLIEGD